MPRFFGLTPSDREAILEQHYFLVRYLGMSYAEVRALPIPYRDWFIKRYIRELEERKSAHTRAEREASSSMDKSATLVRAFSR